MRSFFIYLVVANLIALSSHAFLFDSVQVPNQQHNIAELLPEFCIVETYSTAHQYRFFSGTSAYCLNSEPLNIQKTTGIFIIPFFWNWGKVDELTEEFIKKNNLEKSADIRVRRASFEIYLAPESKMRNFCIVNHKKEKSDFKSASIKFSVNLRCTDGKKLSYELDGGHEALVSEMEKNNFVLLPELNKNTVASFVIFGQLTDN